MFKCSYIIHITDDVYCGFEIIDGVIEGTYPEMDSVVSHCDVNINTKYGFVMVYKNRDVVYRVYHNLRSRRRRGRG